MDVLNWKDHVYAYCSVELVNVVTPRLEGEGRIAKECFEIAGCKRVMYSRLPTLECIQEIFIAGKSITIPSEHKTALHKAVHRERRIQYRRTEM
uniref:SFRICE_033423 n=1 Tax=Spodoptera frugiperda TaxID=7108 RepID=A0A2H1X3T5_SPOFR